MPDSDVLQRYRGWFYAAAVYNFGWGTLVILFPRLLFDLLRIEPPNYLPLWQVVGMFVLVYAPAYFWAARFPDRYPLELPSWQRGVWMQGSVLPL